MPTTEDACLSPTNNGELQIAYAVFNRRTGNLEPEVFGSPDAASDAAMRCRDHAGIIRIQDNLMDEGDETPEVCVAGLTTKPDELVDAHNKIRTKIDSDGLAISQLADYMRKLEEKLDYEASMSAPTVKSKKPARKNAAKEAKTRKKKTTSK